NPSVCETTSAITFESWLPCHATGERPGSSSTSLACGIAAAYASPTACGCPGSVSSELATTVTGTETRARSPSDENGCERGTALSASATASGCSCADSRW